MQTLAALVPLVLTAVAFVAVARAVLRHTDGSVQRGREGREGREGPETRDDPP